MPRRHPRIAARLIRHVIPRAYIHHPIRGTRSRLSRPQGTWTSPTHALTRLHAHRLAVSCRSHPSSPRKSSTRRPPARRASRRVSATVTSSVTFLARAIPYLISHRRPTTRSIMLRRLARSPAPAGATVAAHHPQRRHRGRLSSANHIHRMEPQEGHPVSRFSHGHW
jgi:hypothetical protein